MNNRLGCLMASFAVLASFSASSGLPPPPGQTDPCYFKHHSGCDGAEGFCSNDTVVCDDGWSTLPAIGQGKKSNTSGTSEPRHCYKLSNTWIGPCTGQGAPSGVPQVGCKSSTGNCCWGTMTQEPGDPNGNQWAPDGGSCTAAQ